MVLTGQLVAVEGRLQRGHGVSNIVASHLEDWSKLLCGLATERRETAQSLHTISTTSDISG